MRAIILVYMLAGFGNFVLTQTVESIDKSEQTYSRKKIDYYYYWLSTEKQTLFWDTIYGGERCNVLIINNTKDTLLVEGVYNTSSIPVHWDIFHFKRLYLPGDTIYVRSKISRRNGSFNRPIQIGYHSSLNLNSQRWYLNTKGVFRDTLELQRSQEIKRKAELQELRKNNPNKKYYDNGQVQCESNPNPVNDSLPIYIEYYDNGLVKLEEFRGVGIRKKAYDYLGRKTAEWDIDNMRTEFHPNGYIKFKECKDRYSTTTPFRTHYFINGCLKKEEFANQTIIKEYDSLNCGKLLSQKITESIEDRSQYGKIITHYDEGKIIGQTFKGSGKSKNEVRGEFTQGELKNGTVSYYSSYGILLFEIKIANGERDSVLTTDERRGNQINLVDSKGNKTGLWITDIYSKQPILPPQDFSVIIDNTKNFDDWLYEYSNGDTVALVTFHDYGGISSYSYIRDKQKRIDAHLEYERAYYPNGYIKHKFYELKNGMQVSMRFSEEKENEIISGTKGYFGKLIFKNNELIEIHSEKDILVLPALDSDEETSVKQTHLEEYCVEKGKFRNFELYNGFIYYYNKDGTLRLTEKVVNGIIQGNTRIPFTEPRLIKSALVNDLNFNGWLEQKEVDQISVINLSLNEAQIDQFKWSELKKFKNLSAFNVNGHTYHLNDYANYDSLKVAIKTGKGKKIERYRYSWQPEKATRKKIRRSSYTAIH